MSQLPIGRRDLLPVLRRVEGASQQVAVVHSYLTGAVFIGSTVQEGDAESCLKNGLVLSWYAKPKRGPIWPQWMSAHDVSSASCAVTELCCGTRYIRHAGRVPGCRVEEDDQLLWFSVNGTWISQRSPRLTVSLGSELDVVLNVRGEIPLRSRNSCELLRFA